MTPGTYGTLQGDASPSPPKSYRLSKVAKIALALVACGAAVAIANPGTRPTTINFEMERVGSGLNTFAADVWDSRSSGGGAPATSLQDLEARVAAIEKFLKKGKEGSGTSRGSVMMPGGLGAMARGHGARRRLRGARGRGLGARRS